MTTNEDKTYDGTQKRNYPLLIVIGLALCALDAFCFMRYWDWWAHDIGNENTGTLYGFAAFMLVLFAPLMVWVNAKAWYMELLFGKVKVNLSTSHVRLGETIQLNIAVRSQNLGNFRAQAKFITYQRRHKTPAEIEKESYTYLSGHGNAQVLVKKYEDTILVEQQVGNYRGSTNDQGCFEAGFSYFVPKDARATGRTDDLEFFSVIKYEISSENHFWKGEEAIRISPLEI